MQGFLLLLLTAFALVSARPNQYFTEPDIAASHLQIELNEKDKTAPGHVFITLEGGKDHSHFGPYIFNKEGILLWHGGPWTKHFAVNLHVCDYKGVRGKHLCFSDVSPKKTLPEGIRGFNGHSDGAIRILDNTYREATPPFVQAGDLLTEPDFHELNMVEDGESLLQDVYNARQTDLKKFCGPEKATSGYVYDACFQEVDVRTRKVKFSWCALDHVPVHDSYLYVKCKGSRNETHAIAGHGTWLSPWDFFHINSIDKNVEGDFLVSSRHLDTIFKIAGNNNPMGKKPGELIWRFGGKHSDFVKEGPLKNVSRQHHTRFISTSAEEEVFSVFNNAWDGSRYIFSAVHTTSDHSSGMVISINNKTKKASMLAHYPYRDPKSRLAGTQGSMQTLPNGNVFMGWGDLHKVTEHTKAGKLVFKAKYTNADRSYRSYRFPWVGEPAHPPKLLVYSQNCFSAIYAYVSWNGATEVRNWQFWYSRKTPRGPWQNAGVWAKAFFETSVNFTTDRSQILAIDARYVYADALDRHNKVIGSSPVVETFVPNSTIADKCSEQICSALEQFRYSSQYSVGASCPRPTERHSLWLATLLLATVELGVWAFTSLLFFPVLLKIRPRRRNRTRLPPKVFKRG